MFKVMDSISNLVRAVVSLALITIVGVGGWFGYQTYYEKHLAVQNQLREKNEELSKVAADLAESQQELTVKNRRIEEQQADIAAKSIEIEEQAVEIAAQAEEIDRLDTALSLLKVDHRVARLAVAGQMTNDDGEVEHTTVQFVEVNNEGDPLEQPREFTIDGDIVYIDAWVAKFVDENVEQGVPLRSTSICLFRRLFGEKQSPAEGFPLDAVGSRPVAYNRGTRMSELEEDIWGKFWQYANNPKKAEAEGLRALQGEAPSIRLMPGKQYEIFLRASDGLTIRVVDDAPIAPPGNRPTL